MRVLLILTLSLFATMAFATPAPFQPWETDLISKNIIDVPAEALLIGNSVGKIGAAAAYGLGITIPANAIMVRSWFYTVTQFVDAGSGTVALSCETANNIFSAADITGNADGVLVDGVQQAFATFDGTGAAGILGSACELTATVATAAQTAGKLILFVEYLIAE